MRRYAFSVHCVLAFGFLSLCLLTLAWHERTWVIYLILGLMESGSAYLEWLERKDLEKLDNAPSYSASENKPASVSTSGRMTGL